MLVLEWNLNDALKTQIQNNKMMIWKTLILI